MDRLQGGAEHLPEAALSPEAAAIAAEVLGNDDLLREVLLRLSLPTFLVRAACVCKRWLRIVSSQGFLDGFRRLHPPRLLGSFPNKPQHLPKLLPCSGLPAELIAVTRHAKAYFSRVSKNMPFGNYVILDMRNGHMLVAIADVRVQTRLAVSVCTPLKATPPVYLPFSQLSAYRGTNKGEFDMFEFLPEDGGDGRSYFEVRVIKRYNGDPRVILATVGSCQDGVRGEHRATGPMRLPRGFCWSCRSTRGLLCGSKFYVLSSDGYILGLDLVNISLFYIYLPEEVEMVQMTKYDYYKNVDLSRGENSSFYLIYLKGLQICVWLHDSRRGDNTSNWVLVDTICLLQVFDPFAKHNFNSQGCRIYLLERSGDNTEFVYLSISDTIDNYSDTDYLLHLKSRAVEVVSESHWQTTSLLNPFMMIWPTPFPALMNEEDEHGHVGL